jgi:DNA polymerase
MLVGEAPGAEEEKQYEPFVGPAGQTLTKMLAAMELDRKDVYISNIVKFRPIKTPGSEVGNRPPTPEEIEQFRPYIMEEVRVIKPEIILALGGTATKGLLQLAGSMGSLHGRFHDLEGTPVMVTYHPSWLLQYGTLQNKRTVWEDLLLVMERLGLPISARQRGFFLPKE